MVLHMPAGKLSVYSPEGAQLPRDFRLTIFPRACVHTTCSNSVYPDYDISFTINIYKYLLCMAFVEIESPLAFYSMINSIVLFFCNHGDML